MCSFPHTALTIPRAQLRYRTENENSGVGLKSSNRYVLIPFAHRTLAHSYANLFELFCESKAITTPLLSFPLSIISLATPCVV